MLCGLSLDRLTGCGVTLCDRSYLPVIKGVCMQIGCSLLSLALYMDVVPVWLG